MASSSGRRLNIDNINPHARAAKYAVRGELAVRSEEYRAQLQSGMTDLPFTQVISANIGNPQQLDQKPLTFFRQVLSILENPALLDKKDVLVNHLDYKPDVLERASRLLKQVGSVGAYSASNGAPAIRQSIADFLESKAPSKNCYAPLVLTRPLQGAMDSLPTKPTFTSRQVPLRVSTPSCTSSAPTTSRESWCPSRSTPCTPLLFRF